MDIEDYALLRKYGTLALRVASSAKSSKTEKITEVTTPDGLKGYAVNVDGAVVQLLDNNGSYEQRVLFKTGRVLVGRCLPQLFLSIGASYLTLERDSRSHGERRMLVHGDELEARISALRTEEPRADILGEKVRDFMRKNGLS